ncbi:uncharacterized protein [Rutidosis leptorrhynchoides]|uniref:uncharacterized protein n=1 Tax=Rutidosis leptorrhynchoides TaxID=125765 RepID=UPI003A98DE63
MEQNGTTNLRTRSKAAPDWTVEESLILVNEIAAIEADCGGTLSSFQKWKIIVQNCNVLDVNRNLNQCRRKWDSLLSDYKKIKQSGSRMVSFNSELFKAVEQYVRVYKDDYDSEAENDFDELPVAQSGILSYLRCYLSLVITPENRTMQQTAKPTRCLKSENDEVEECRSEQEVCQTDTVDESTRLVEVGREEHEQNIAEILRENAELIEAIANNKNATFDLTRINGDKIISCLSKIAFTLDELCKLQTGSVV